MSDISALLKRNYHFVIELPGDYTVNDFTRGYDENRHRPSEYDIGRYNEKRPSMYEGKNFIGRDIHMGIDIGAPVGTPVFAFFEGSIYSFGYNSGKGDYGYTIVTRHQFEKLTVYALFGHLSKTSLLGKSIDSEFNRGDILGYVGDRHENGDWNPHLHFQLSLLEPGDPTLPGLSEDAVRSSDRSFDLPGVVSEKERERALFIYPDPRIVLGQLY